MRRIPRGQRRCFELDLLRQRQGVIDFDPETGLLTAEAGIAIFRVAFERWTSGSEQRELAELLNESLAALKAVVSSS